MHFKFPLLLSCCLLSSVVLADDIHKVGASLDYHLDQDSATGYGAFYQWQFGESIEFEANYIQSNDITVEKDQGTTVGDYSHLLLGANFIKNFNEQLSIKAGTGIGYVLTSSNQALIEKQSFAPYLKLSANYQINDQFAVEVGQFTHFQGNDLATNFALFVGVTFQFGAQAPTIIERNNQKISSAQPKVKAVSTPTHTETANKVTAVVNANKVESKPARTKSTIGKAWFVQLGAFKAQQNAQVVLAKYRMLANLPKLTIIHSNGYFRVVSMPFTSKQRADDHIDSIAAAYRITGYVTQLALN